ESWPIPQVERAHCSHATGRDRAVACRGDDLEVRLCANEEAGVGVADQGIREKRMKLEVVGDATDADFKSLPIAGMQHNEPFIVEHAEHIGEERRATGLSVHAAR